MISHFLSIAETPTISHLIDHAVLLKRQHREHRMEPFLAGKTLGLIFEKPSIRTRVSFEMGMFQLGGNVITLKGDEIGFNKRESVADISRVMSRYVDAVMIRSFHHSDIVEFATNATIPVINGLSDLHHPCQAMADGLTILERFGQFSGLTLTYVGDGNNVCRSLIELASATGMSIRIACPKGYEPTNAGDAVIVNHVAEAVSGAHIVYTDVWTSMGQETESQQRLNDFSGFQVNDDVMSLASKDAIFMHCLPAHRGEEVTHSVLESASSVVFDQAENRLHAQKAILVALMEGDRQ